MTCISNSWSFVVDFGRPITLLSPKNLPGTHQYAVTLVAQIVAQILWVLLKQNLLDKVSWHMNLFPVLPNEYYTFVTSPFLSASPSPAPVCSIFGSPNRLDLWLDLCLKLLFDCKNNWKVTNGVAVDIYLKFVVILFDFGRSVTLLSPKNMPGTHQYVVTPFPNIGCQHECEPMPMQCLQRMPAPQAAF